MRIENEGLRILVIKFRNIGDVLLTTPVIRNLKLNYPNSIIDIAINKECKDIISSNPDINKIYTYDRKNIKSLPFFKRIREEIKFIKSISKNSYDLIINLTEGDRGSLISLFTKANKKVGFKRNFLSNLAFDINMPSQKNKHTIEWNLDSLRVLDKKIYEKKVYAYCEKEDEDFIDFLNLPNKFVHFHPVSRWLFKCIDDKISAEIIDFIENDLNLRVVLTAAPIKKEIEKIENILKYSKSKPINLAGKLTLKQTIALNKRALFFIGVDTAIMHIAAALDTPVLAFFGPSGAFHWGPWDNKLTESGYKKRNGYQTMGKHRVIQVDWKCAPCGKDGCNGSKISDCLMQKGLNLEFIKQNIKEMYENIRT